MENYSILCQIGKGACGAVYLVRHTETKKLYALKKIQLDESRKTRTKEAVLREAKILSELKHPHIVAYHDSFFDEKEEHLCIIQDYCDGGTLEDLIREAAHKNVNFQEKQIVQWFLQLSLAVRYMHSKKVLHRDLKASNVFMNKSATLCKIGDFGIAKSMDTIDVASTCVGTPCYLSPEMCQDIPYSSKADVWALGCMLYEMVAQKPAFDAHNLVSLFYKIVKGEYDPLPDGYSDNLVNLVKTVLVKTPEDRPSARGVLALPYLREELLKFIEEKEFILQQQRLPTRQGSRPYSTPNLDRLPNFRSKRLPNETEEEAAKRAASCRPNIINRGKERSILISAKPSSRALRVTTILEEPEDTEKNLRLEKALDVIEPTINENDTDVSLQKAQGSLSPSSDRKLIAPNEDSTFSAETVKQEADVSVNKQNHSDVEIKLQLSPKLPVKANHDADKNHGDVMINKSPRVEKNKTSFAKIDISSIGAKEFNNNKNINNQTVLKLDFTGPKSKDNFDFREFDNEPPKRHKIQEPMRTPRIQEPNALIIEVEPILRTPRIVVTPQAPQTPPQTRTQTPRNVTSPGPATTGLTRARPTTAGLTRARPTTASQTTARPTSAGLTTTAPSPTHSTSKKKQTPNKEKKKTLSAKNLTKQETTKRSRGSGKSSSKSGKRKPESKESRLSIPSEKLDYYSDDFDNSLSESGSDIEEIPEEIPEYRRSIPNSFTQTFEIPEIEEDLPDGLEADDEDNFDDFDDDDIEEDLDDVVTVAREACDDLDLESSIANDEVVIDETRRPNTSSVLKKHCLDMLGREKYDKVKKFFENNDEPEIRKIEKAIGKEHSKTIYLMTEISRKKKLRNS